MSDDELAALTLDPDAQSVGGRWERVLAHSLGWVTARGQDDALIGFVNVAGEGGEHAFLLDTTVRPDHRLRGVGTALVHHATVGARAAGCTWLHVDLEPHLAGFYLEACGFRPTDVGLVSLSQ